MINKLATTVVGDVTTRSIARVQGDARLSDVVTEITERRRGAVIVEDDSGAVVGIFTERDLITRVDHANHAWHDTPVDRVMTTNPKTIAETESISDAIHLMSAGTFRHLPVCDSSGRAVGLLSIRDILAHIAEYFPKEFLNLPPDPMHEASARWGG